jgi:hypothetical protein
VRACSAFWMKQNPMARCRMNDETPPRWGIIIAREGWAVWGNEVEG